MAIIRNSFIAAALAAGAPLAAPAHAGESMLPAKVLSPLEAGTFKMAGKQALTYYFSEKNSCKVTVLLTDVYDESKQPSDIAVRFNTSIFAGTSTRVETNEGPSLAMVCAPGAATLFVQSVDRVASVAGAK